MAQLDNLESKLDDVLNKKAPFKLPENARRTFAGALWWLALAAGVLQLWSAWSLWDNWHRVDQLADWANSYAAAFGVDSGVGGLGAGFYLSLVVLAVSGALLLLGAPGLKAFKKAGWNFVFYSLLVNLVYGVVVAFTDYGGFGDLFGALLGSLIGAYLLFQVRGHFMKSSTVTSKV